MKTLISAKRIPILLLIVLATQPLRADLILKCRFGGHEYEVASLEHGRAFVIDAGNKVEVPKGAAWRLEGDLRENADLVLLSPAYNIFQAYHPLPTGPLGVSYVGLNYRKSPTEPNHPDGFLKHWPGGVPDEALAVFVWTVAGRVTALQVRHVLSTVLNDSFSVTAEFPLDENSMPGQPVLALWQDGRIRAPVAAFPEPALNRAAACMLLGDLTPLRTWIEAGGSVNASRPDGTTLLHLAAEAGNDEAVAYLLQKGAKPNVHSRTSGPPLQWAASKGRERAVELLLAAKAKPSINIEDQGDALHAAIMNGSIPIVRRLIAAGADLDSRGVAGNVPVSLALNSNRTEILRLLLKAGASYDFSRPQMERVLMSKVASGQVEMVGLLLENGVNPNAVQDDATPLIIAARFKGDERMAKVLLAGGAKLYTEAAGVTPLAAAAAAGNVALARALVEAGAEVNRPNKAGRTALHVAAVEDQTATAAYLLSASADPLLQDKAHQTPLDTALLSGAKAVAGLLAARGQHLALDGPAKEQELDSALRFDRADLIERALADGWPADYQFAGHWPALWLAHRYGATACLETLQHHGLTGAAGERVLATVHFPSDSIDRRPTLLARVAPLDPRDAKANYPAQDIAFDAIIDERGRLLFPVVARSDNDMLERSSLLALAQWRFSPAISAGHPVAIQVRLPLGFPASWGGFREIQNVDVLPKVLKAVKPVYPRELTRDGQNGIVTLRFIVELDGHPGHIEVVSSSAPELEQAAIDAFNEWRFQPGMADGAPVRVRAVQAIVFQMRRS